MINQITNCNAFSGANDLLNASELFDVTLVCDDGQVLAHKLILYSGSNVLQSILRRSTHPHPLIYLRGLKMIHLQKVIDFLYRGKVDLAELEFENFIELAQELQIQGMTFNLNYGKEGSVEDVIKQIHPILKNNSNEDVVCDVEAESPQPIELEIAENEDRKDTIELPDNISARIDDEKSNSPAPAEFLTNSLSTGIRFGSYEEAQKAIKDYCDANFSPLICVRNNIDKRNSSVMRQITYGCPYGVARKTKSQGIRFKPSRYVGCPAHLRVNEQSDGTFLVVKSQLNHQEHEISEEAYAKMRKTLTKEQEESLKDFLDGLPTLKEISIFLEILTGRKFSTLRSKNIAFRLGYRIE